MTETGKSITILGSSLDYANNYLVSNLCQLDYVRIVIYDISKTSAHGIVGAKLLLQANMAFPRKDVVHTEDLEVATATDVILFWGVVFPDAYFTAYKEFFSGKFKKFIELHGVENPNYSPEIVFLKSQSSGLKAAQLLGAEIPGLKKSISVLSAASDGIAEMVYPKTDGTYDQLEGMDRPVFTKMIHDLQNVDGGLVDVDVVIRFIRNCVCDSSPKGDIFDYVGRFPDKNEQQKWGLSGKVCIFLPMKDDPKYSEKLKELLRAEEADMIKFIKK